MAIIYFISAKDTEKLQTWLHNTFSKYRDQTISRAHWSSYL